MNEKLMNRVAEAKKQTIGVEVEMNNITRRNAAKIAAEYFGTNQWEDTARTNGYSTWSAWDAQGREWKFQKDVSIHGADSEKCELVTPILHYEDIETLQELCRRLRKAGAKSDATRGCGVHIHIGANGHTAQTLRNLANIMASHEELLVDALKLDRGSNRYGHYCKPVNPEFLRELNHKKPTTMAELADIWYRGNGANYGRSQHYNDSRYHMLNLHATFTKGTIEFRLFQFDAPADGKQNGIHAGQLKSYIQLCLLLSQMAKEAKAASAKPQQTENPKYAMRTWLLRLGFIGEEFATAREMLTRNLAGDTAFRNGRAA
ncbi:MAG: amidoligase family protein [Clostridia bacterium]|nr:amidoligase family protein [Clostridia bacterium]